MTASPATVRAAAAALASAAPPSDDGEPVFAEPWEGRAYGLALDLVERRKLPWSAFRDLLIAAIETNPQRPYYECWVIALEQLAMGEQLVDAIELAHERSDVGAYRYLEADSDIEVVPLIHSRAVLVAHFGGDIAVDTAHHIEMYRVWDAGSPNRVGVRAFDVSGATVADLVLAPDDWVVMRDSLLSFPTAPSPG